MEVLFLSLLVGGFLYYRQAKEFGSKYKVSFFGLSVNKAETVASGFSKLVFTVSVKLVNPTDFVGKVDSVDLKFLYQGLLIGQVSKGFGVLIEKQSSTVLKVPVSVDVLSVVKVAKDLFKRLTATGKIPLTCIGQLSSAAGVYSFKKDFEVNVYVLPSAA